MASEPEYLAWIAAALTEGAVAEWMQHALTANQQRSAAGIYPQPQPEFLLETRLGGGGVASLRIDPQGKAFAQQLLEFPIPVPSAGRRFR